MTAETTTPDERENVSDATAEQLLEYARKLTDPDGPLLGDRDAERAGSIVKHMADAMGIDIITDVADKSDLVLTGAGHGDDTQWAKHSEEVFASVDIGPMYIQTDHDNEAVDNVGMEIRVQPSGDDAVYLDTSIDGEFRGYEFRHGGNAKFTAKQADALAAALVEAAEQARQGGA